MYDQKTLACALPHIKYPFVAIQDVQVYTVHLHAAIEAKTASHC